ncbi:MAG: ligase [Verrucomicrobia bacterium]|jgi:DNA ligase-1|nr:ligase [Verrucomicrobiota bacterium]
MSALEFQFHYGGIFLPRLNLWLDPHFPKVGPEKVFVSHAHSDHTGAHREVILSEATALLMQARIGGERLEHRLAFHQGKEFIEPEGRYRITLRPAGHIFGSAMSLIESEGGSLLYTGDFKLRRGLSAEPCEPCTADTLIMETTYGQPKYEFPPTAEVMQGIMRFCQQAVDNDETPVLFGYSLGKSQEILSGLAKAGLPIMLHSQVHKLTKIYEQLGHIFPPYEKLDPATARGKVLVCPPNANRSAVLRQVGPIRTAVLTGWAIDPGCRYQSQCDAAFPLSDHADFPDLIEFVKRVVPRRVYTLHGFAADFAQTLRDLGFDAQALSESEQLSFRLDVSTPKKLIAPAPLVAPAVDQAVGPATDFLRFAETCESIGSTTKKLEKTERLADYLATLSHDDLAAVTTWFTGQAFGPGTGKVLQLGWSIIRAAVCATAGLPETRFRQVYLKHSDTGETVFEIFSQITRPSPSWSIADISRLFAQLHAARGPTGKTPLLTQALGGCTPLEAKFLVKILTGDLRIGLKEGLVEEAVAKAFSVTLDEVKRANLLLGDIGETSLLAQTGTLQSAGLIPMRPVKCMLASPEETAVDVWARVASWRATNEEGQSKIELSESAVLPVAWLEDKYDGIRCQAHKVGRHVELYSRDLKLITATFPELVEKLSRVPRDFILDGEVLAMRGEQVLSFGELQKRLGRRESDLFMHEEVPIRYIAFDLLWQEGETLLDVPLRARRKRLEQLHEGVTAFQLALVTPAQSHEEIEAAFTAARARNNEGLIIKDPLSTYSPGRRGLSWLKLKKALATLDCVVVGAEWGHGKRKAVLSDYTFAVRDEQTGELKTIGKAYSGLTDVEIAELTKYFLKHVVRQRGRYHEVTPDVVLEIAFDAIQESDRHASGLAMRFPRIARIRTDKTVAEIDTVASARRLLKSEP